MSRRIELELPKSEAGLFDAAVQELLKIIAEKDQGSKISDCVISCPVFFTDAQRRALLDASQIAGLKTHAGILENL